MKQLLITITVIIASVFLLTTNQIGAESQYVNDADMVLIDGVTEQLNQFILEVNKDPIDTVSLKIVGDDLNIAIDTLFAHNFTNKLGSKYTKATVVFKSFIVDISKKVTAVLFAYETENESNIATALMNFGLIADDYDAQIKLLNDSVDQANLEADNSEIYVFALIAAVMTSIGSFVWSIKKKDKNSNLHQARKTIAINSLLPLAGSLITYISYALTPAGGSYTVMWGLIVVGIIAYVRSISSYMTLIKISK